MTKIQQFPHCDPRVLHAPGECKYCDERAEWQELRQVWGIAFTGYAPTAGGMSDPATQARDLYTINKWPGNRAVKE